MLGSLHVAEVKAKFQAVGKMKKISIISMMIVVMATFLATCPDEKDLHSCTRLKARCLVPNVFCKKYLHERTIHKTPKSRHFTESHIFHAENIF